MNRLANALAFAVVVLAVVVMEARTQWPQYSPGQLVACLAHTYLGPHSEHDNDLPVLASLPVPPAPPVAVSVPAPVVDVAQIERIMARTQAVRQRVMRAEMRRVMMQAKIDAKAAKHNCTVVRVDQ